MIMLCCTLPLMGQTRTADDTAYDDSLRREAESLLTEWMDTFLDYQCTHDDPALDGGVLCPACARIHGRIGDAVLPLMYLADRTGDEKYLLGAKRLMSWMENIHYPDGAWMNDVNVSDWNGTTVFAAIALYEALHYHGHLLDKETRELWTRRLTEAGEFLMNNPFIYSRKREGMRNMNVNYSASATYALYAIGTMCDRPEFKRKAEEIAEDLKTYFTENDCFLYGEGPNITSKTRNGCRPVDLLYNVEESLPNMASYAVMAGDSDLLSLVDRSIQTHLEFMLPDGAWDNSWGTRSFKWTYWGGRTSDGFMGGYYLMASVRNHPDYCEAIRRNIHLLSEATHNGLLEGGMHYDDCGIPPCIHHTFGHAKALASFLEQPAVKTATGSAIKLPRDAPYGVKHFRDIRTWLVSEGPWRATVTGNDAEYKVKGTHPMGGAISLLWHEQAGPIFAATMNKYQLIEAPNMQSVPRKYILSGTPRVETVRNGISYSNLDDLDTEIICNEDNHRHVFEVTTHLVDINQQPPEDGAVSAKVYYSFSGSGIDICVENCGESSGLVLPVISSPREDVRVDAKEVRISKDKGTLIVHCESGDISIMPTDSDGRIFNPVPGFAFVPVRISPEIGTSRIQVSISFRQPSE